MKAPFYHEDFVVGQRFAGPERRVMEADAIKAFAIEYDPQPMHTDEAAAKAGRYGGLIASGWQTAAVTMRLMMSGGLPPIAGGSVGAGVEGLNWPRPVRPGDTLAVETEVLEVRVSRSRPEFGLVRLRATTRNQSGETVQEMTTTLFVPRRGAGL
ncbi:MAG TPA: MaoC family dehydratase [Acetobacteraceae bacterium]|nr:MaoC family dehydratase [Acetobacteraceae bacterium]